MIPTLFLMTLSQIDNQNTMSTPSITLQNESLRMVNYEFPDPNKSYILSDAGKNYKILENGALLLSFQKGYYPQEFAIKISDVPTFSIAKKIFSGSLPISGDAKKALSLAILKAGKTTTTLKNRM